MKPCILIFLALLPGVSAAQFIPPVEGIQNRDWFLVNYPDRDTAIGSIRDYRCDNETYDGHQGTDFVIRDFRQMDSGVIIRAAMAGKVFATKDSLFDRSEQGDSGGYGNFISISHGDSLFTIYAHLRKFSLRVKLGDSVTRGEPIALLGSSGKTSDPHCHFEVWHNGVTIDPWGDSCVSVAATPGMFVSRPFYDDSTQIISAGITAGTIGLDSIRMHPPDIGSSPIKDTAITFWIHGLSHPAGIVEIDWIAPDGSGWFSLNESWNTYYRYWYDWTWINTPPASMSGVWSVKYSINGRLLATTQFTIPTSEVKTTSGASVPFVLSPNPAQSLVRISELDMSTVRIYDPIGRLVACPGLSEEGIFDCSRLANGMYTVVGTKGSRTRGTKLLVLH